MRKVEVMASLHTMNTDLDMPPDKRQRNGRRARRPSLNGDEFLERTLELFLDEGYEGTSIDRITSEIGIAKRSVYLRFGNKKSLLAALKKAIDDWIIPIDTLRGAETGDLEQTLLAVGRLLVENVPPPAGIRLLQLTNQGCRKMPEIASFSVHYGTDPTLDYLEELFSRHHRQPDGSRDAAEAYLHLVVGGPANAVSSGLVIDKSAIDARIAFSVGIFLHGLVPPANPVAKAEELAARQAECARLRDLLGDLAERVDQTIAVIDALSKRTSGDELK